MNVDSHRQIVRQCSYCLLHLYRHTKLPTAFISAIASAALTLSLELIDQPSQPYNFEIRTIIIECFSRLQTNSSPIIGRACQVLEYFLDPTQPRVGIPRSYEGALREWQELDNPEACSWHTEDATRENRSDWFVPPGADQRDATLSLSANPAFPIDARDLCYPTKSSPEQAACESNGTPMLNLCSPLKPSPEQSSEMHGKEQASEMHGIDFGYSLQPRVEQIPGAQGLNWHYPSFS